MGAGTESQTHAFDGVALCQLMPMHIAISETGIIMGLGPTILRISDEKALIGARFCDQFQIKHPPEITSIQDLRRFAGARIYTTFRGQPNLMFRSVAVPLQNGGMLMNLSFGSSLADAVSAYDLTDADFAPTDLAVELLYLIEAKSIIMAQLNDTNASLRGAKKSAEEMAMTDALTGLRNRRAMDVNLSELIARHLPFGMMNVDLDYFKDVNDTLGHAAGDALLQHVALVLKRVTRANDTIARVGGDEFVVLLPGLTDLDVLTRIGRRLIAALTKPFVFQGQTCRISASIGITVSTTYQTPASDQMLHDADNALYASKHAGRGQVSVHQP